MYPAKSACCVSCTKRNLNAPTSYAPATLPFLMAELVGLGGAFEYREGVAVEPSVDGTNCKHFEMVDGWN